MSEAVAKAVREMQRSGVDCTEFSHLLSQFFDYRQIRKICDKALFLAFKRKYSNLRDRIHIEESLRVYFSIHILDEVYSNSDNSTFKLLANYLEKRKLSEELFDYILNLLLDPFHDTFLKRMEDLDIDFHISIINNHFCYSLYICYLEPESSAEVIDQ